MGLVLALMPPKINVFRGLHLPFVEICFLVAANGRVGYHVMIQDYHPLAYKRLMIAHNVRKSNL